MSLMKAMQVSRPGGDFELVQREIPEPNATVHFRSVLKIGN